MYKQSKRFLAGFLAFLLVVTMIPTDLLGVVYAAEAVETVEDDADVPESTIADDDAEEAEVLENADADDDADAEEVLDENDIVKDGESAEEPKSEGENPPTPSQPESTPTPSQPESTPQPSEPASTTPEPSEPESTPESAPQPTDPVEEVNNWELDMIDAVYEGGKPLKKKIGDSTIDTIFTATTGFTLDTGTINTADGKTFTGRLKTGGKSSHTSRCIEFTPTKPGKLIVYAVPSSSATDRALRLDVGDAENGQSITALSPAVRMEFNVTEVGKVHHLGSTNSGINIGYISMEYTAESVSLDESTVSIKVTDKDGKEVTSPKYTGDAYSIGTTVTDKDGKLINSSRYKVSYERKDADGNNWSATEDLTSAGTIRVKVENAEGNNLTGSKTSDEIVIAKADLETGNRTINHAPSETGVSGEYDIAALFAETAGADTLSFALDTNDSNYVAGNVIENPVITNDKKLTYTVVSTVPDTVTSAVLAVKVTSDNYNDKTFTITVTIREKVSVTVKLESKTHVYNKEAYGFDDNVVITDVTGEGITEDNKEEAIADLKDNLSYKFQADGGDAVSEEPVDVGTYTVTVELASASAYTLSSSATDATLTISPKPVKIKAKDTTWDKSLKDAPAPGEAKAEDYEFIAATEGETDFGLVAGDTVSTQPAIKYFKKDTETEMTADDWSALTNEATVDIVLSGADAGANYDIAYEKGTLTTLVRTAVAPTNAIPEATGATLLPGNITAASSSKVSLFSQDGCFIFTADESNTVTAEASRLKTDGTGTPFYRSIGFTVTKAANIAVTCTSANNSSVRPVYVGKVNEDGTITEITIGDANKNNSAELKAVIENAGTYYIYSKGFKEGTAGGINVTKVEVSYDNVVVPVRVNVTPTISEADLAKLDGAQVYFRAADGTEIAVTSGSAAELIQSTEYTAVVKNADGTVSDTLEAKINGSLSYTPSADANVTITIEEKSGPTTVTVTPTISAEDQAKLGNAKVVFVEKGETPITVTSGEAVTLKKDTEYVLNVVNVPDGVTFTAKIDGKTTYTPSADANVTITIDKKQASNVATPVADPADGAELPTAGGTVKLTCATTGATIYYTTDDSDPADATNTERKEYTEAGIEIKVATTLRAVAVVGEDVSDELVAHYTILPEGGIPMPTSDKPSGKVDFGTTVTLSCSDTEAKIYYAINGTEPTKDSYEYTEPITITETIIIKAVAIKGDKSSAVATFEYEVEQGEEPGPVEKVIQLKDCVITVPSVVEGSKTGVVTYVTYKDPDTKKTVKFTEGIDYTVAAKEGATNTLILTGAERDPFDGRSVDGYSISKENPVEKTYNVISKVNAKNKSQYIDVSKAKITLSKTETKGLYYTGYAQEPSLDFSKAPEYKTLYEAGRLNIAYRNNINAGKATVIISVVPEAEDQKTETQKSAGIETFDTDSSGEPNSEPGTEAPPAADTSKVYYGAKTLTFNIKKAALNKNNAKATAEARVVLPKDLNYGGDAITADSIQVVTKPAAGNGMLLRRNSDYTVTYKNNQKAGKATITLKGIGNNLSGSYAVTYTIGALNLADWKFDMTSEELEEAFVYSPKGARLTWFWISKGEAPNKEWICLNEGIDYTAKYTYADKKDKKAGTKVTVAVKGKNGCTGTVTVPELTIAKADFANCVKLTGKKGLYYDGGESVRFFVDSSSKKDVKTDLEKTVIVTDNAGVKLNLNKDYQITAVTPSAITVDATTTAKTEYIIQPSGAAKDNYKEKTAENPYVQDSVSIEYVVATNLAKDKNFIFDKNLEKTDPLGYDGRNPVEITQAALDKYINKYDGTNTTAVRKYEIGWNIEIVEGSYKNNAKKGTAQVTVRGIGDPDEARTGQTIFYGTKVLKFKVVEK